MQLSGDTDKHGILREKICDFIYQNTERLKGWVTAVEEHLRSVGRQCVFGTQLELKAVSTMFNVSIYVATNSLLSNGHYIWTKIAPVTSCTFSDRQWLAQFNTQKKSWLEICHQNGCHYDSIKPMLQGRFTMVPPPLKQGESALIDLDSVTD